MFVTAARTRFSSRPEVEGIETTRRKVIVAPAGFSSRPEVEGIETTHRRRRDTPYVQQQT